MDHVTTLTDVLEIDLLFDLLFRLLDLIDLARLNHVNRWLRSRISNYSKRIVDDKLQKCSIYKLIGTNKKHLALVDDPDMLRQIVRSFWLEQKFRMFSPIQDDVSFIKIISTKLWYSLPAKERCVSWTSKNDRPEVDYLFILSRALSGNVNKIYKKFKHELRSPRTLKIRSEDIYKIAGWCFAVQQFMAFWKLLSILISRGYTPVRRIELHITNMPKLFHDMIYWINSSSFTNWEEISPLDIIRIYGYSRKYFIYDDIPNEYPDT